MHAEAAACTVMLPVLCGKARAGFCQGNCQLHARPSCTSLHVLCQFCLQVSNRIYTLSLELYNPTSANLARYAFEILLAGCIVLLNIIEIARFAQAARWSWRGRLDKGLGQHLSSIGVWLRLANNVLLLVGLGLWWTFVNKHAKQFNMDLRYPVRLACRNTWASWPALVLT
jgi:hypothetical protein